MRLRASALALGLAATISFPVHAMAAPALPSSSDVPLPAQLNELSQRLPETPLLVPPPVHHEGAPTPQAFAPEQMALIYPSDFSSGGPFYFHAVQGFDELRANHPEVLEANLRKTIEINNSASAEQIERALADDHDDLMLTMSDAWGPILGGHFRDAVAENRLPKTYQILSGTLARGGMVASSTFAEKYYYGYDRPFVVADESITRYHRNLPGDDDEYGTTPSYPSGHTNQATWKSTLMATMLPELGVQMLARGSEVGYNRLVLGVHYPLDVIGGRQSGTAAAIDRLTDPYFSQLLAEAAAELRAELEWRCGTSIAECIAADSRYLSDEEAVRVYTERMTYGFEQIGPTDRVMDIPPYSELLLATRFPELDWQQRQAVLHLTAIESGYPLDQAENSFNRLNVAAAWVAKPTVLADGGVTLN